MVMETPSPQCVGLEFVRQYYTVLNKAPMHLHRFYSHNSLFMHGGPNSVNDPTVGQSDIHKKIISLNFQDCHAKIRMVDAHATLGEGVVIQVTGELSNNGMPMRRFMQTFVLAPQSPKKYYVHNDIFRYQDEVFCEEEPVEEGISEPEEELESDSPCAVDSTAYPSNSTTINGSAHHNHHEPELSSPIQVPASASSTSTHISSPSQSQVSPPPTSVPAPTLPPVPVTPPVAAPTPISSEPPRPATPPAEEEDSWGTPGPASDEWTDTMEENVPIIAKKETPVKKENKSSTLVQPELPLPPPTIPSVVNEPKTFANLFKNSSSTSNFNQSLSSSTQPASQTHPEPSVVPQPSFSAQPPRSESTNNRPNSIASGTGPSPGSAQSSSYGGSNFRNNRNFYDEDKRRPTVPDTQQVFVGNLPHSIGEDELKSEFAQYGKILEVRINTGKGKSTPKGPGGHQVPNFGFIAFDDEDSVTKCLNARPIYLNGESRINVEEKKARRTDGMMGNTGRPSSGRGGLGESGGGGGGMRGGRGGMNQGRDSRGGGRGSYSRGDNNRGGPGGSRGGGFVQRR